MLKGKERKRGEDVVGVRGGKRKGRTANRAEVRGEVVGK